VANIGDVMLRVLADMAGFEAEVTKGAQKAGDKAGQTLSQRIGSSLKANAGKALFGALAAGAAIATRGVLELEEATAQFRAETGATAEEAERAGKAINDMAGRNMQPLEEVGRTLAKVHTDLGLSGDAAEAAAESFLKYGRATGRDAAEGVSALDDILDAWNLDAERSGEIMDKLIASHQEYGGSISDNEAALSNLAPQLQALNLDVDDGIGLLNLFASSGLDASKAQFALNSAIQKLPPGESLDQFIARLSTIEDDGERARVAIEVFGARGGAGLANAIRPGIDSLEDFMVSTDEAAGATQEAADALDSTWGSRFKLLLKGAGSALTGFGAQFGPALTGMASLASLAGSLGGGKLLGGLVSSLKVPVGPLKKIGVRIASAIGLGVASSAAQAAIGEGLGEGIAGAGRSSRVTAATDKLGRFMGTGLGKALSVGFAVAAVAGVIETYRQVQETTAAQTQAIGQAIGEQIADGSLEGMEASRASVLKGLNDLYAIPDFGIVTGPAKDALLAELDRLNDAIRAKGIEAGVAAKEAPEAVAAGLSSGKEQVTAAAGTMMSGVEGAIGKASDDAYTSGSAIPGSVAQGILDHQDDVDTGMAALRNQIENERTPIKQASHVIGTLISEEVANGMTDKREGVRDAAGVVRAGGEEELALYIQSGGKIGKKAMEALIEAENSKDPDVREAANRTRQIIETGVVPDTKPGGRKAGTGLVDGMEAKEKAVGDQSDDMAEIMAKRTAAANTRKSGRTAGQDVAHGLKDKYSVVGRTAYNLGVRIARNVLGGILYTGGGKAEKDDKYVPKATGGMVEPGGMYRVNEYRQEFFVPNVRGQIAPDLAAFEALADRSGTGGNTYQVNLTGLPRVRSPRDIVDSLRMAGEMGHLAPEGGW
jgi:hypothetical protein